jgi:cell division protein ZapA
VAEVDLTIAGRPYRVACRTGEEDSLRAAAALVDARPPIAAPPDPRLAAAAESIAARLELLADTLEGEARSA